MDKKPVAIQLIDSIYRGGAQRVVLDLVRTLPQYQHVVCYWTDENDLEDELRQAGAVLIRLPFNGIATFPVALSALKKVVAQYKPSVIHAHMFIPNMLMRSLRGTFVRVSTYHGEIFERGGWRGKAFRWLERRSLKKSDRLIAVSEHVKEYVQRKLNTKKNIEVVYNFPRQASAVVTPVTTAPLRLMATSNYQPYKDYPLLIHAMSQFTSAEVTLDIYGSNMASIEALADGLSLTNVTFKGSVKDVTKLMDQYSAFIITSNSGEGFSLAVIEAMSSGLPIICSDIPQFVEAVDKAAVVFQRSNVASLVSKLRSLIQDRSQLQSLSSQGLERAQLFTQDRFRQAMLRIYNNKD